MCYLIFSSPDSYTKHVPSEQEALCSEAQVFSSRTAVLPKNIKLQVYSMYKYHRQDIHVYFADTLKTRKETI